MAHTLVGEGISDFNHNPADLPTNKTSCEQKESDTMFQHVVDGDTFGHLHDKVMQLNDGEHDAHASAPNRKDASISCQEIDEELVIVTLTQNIGPKEHPIYQTTELAQCVNEDIVDARVFVGEIGAATPGSQDDIDEVFIAAGLEPVFTDDPATNQSFQSVA